MYCQESSVRNISKEHRPCQLAEKRFFDPLGKNIHDINKLHPVRSSAMIAGKSGIYLCGASSVGEEQHSLTTWRLCQSVVHPNEAT